MMKLSKALMLSVSGLMFMSDGSLASIHNLTSFNSPGAVTFVHTPYTHTSHSEETLLSSCEDFNFVTLTRSLRSDLSPLIGRGKIRALSSSDLIRGSRWNEEANLSDLDTPVKPEYDRSPSPLRGEGQGEGDNNLIQFAATCFVTDTSACSGNEFSGNNADDDGHGAPGGPGPALMIIVISKNVFPPVRVITSPAKFRITASVKLATENTPHVKKTLNVPVRN